MIKQGSKRLQARGRHRTSAAPDPSGAGDRRTTDGSVSLRYAAGLLLGLLAALFAYFVMLAVLAGRSETYTTVHIGEWYARKEAALAATPPPRVVFVGGSNVLYGIDAEAFQRATGVRAVNIGTHAALSTAYLFDWVKRRLHKGDLIVLSIEYHSFGSAEPTSIHANYLANRDLGALWRLPPRVGALALMAIDWDQAVLETWRNLKPSWRDSLKGHIREIVDRTIGPLGDYRTHFHRDRGAREEGLMANVKPELPLTGPRPIDPRMAADLSALKDWCARHGIGLVALPPATLDFPEYHTHAANEGQQRYVEAYRAVGIPLLESPAAEFRPRDDFFDSIYHLSYEGMQAHTERLMLILRDFLPR